MYGRLTATSSLFATAAKVRDLWRKKDMGPHGTMTAVTAQFMGDEDSSIFRHTKA